MKSNITEEQRYILAKKKVEELKSYYWHLAIYLIVNTLIIVNKLRDNLDDGETLLQALSDLTIYVTAIIWGIPMLLHTFKILGAKFFFSNDWEERKIQEFMNENNTYERS